MGQYFQNCRIKKGQNAVGMAPGESVLLFQVAPNSQQTQNKYICT